VLTTFSRWEYLLIDSSASVTDYDLHKAASPCFKRCVNLSSGKIFFTRLKAASDNLLRRQPRSSSLEELILGIDYSAPDSRHKEALGKISTTFEVASGRHINVILLNCNGRQRRMAPESPEQSAASIQGGVSRSDDYADHTLQVVPKQHHKLDFTNAMINQRSN
jgi:hypothetical protein